MAHGERGRARDATLRKLLERFGYTASARVRQSSLASVIETLRAWGFGHRLGGTSVNDSITIWSTTSGPAGAQATSDGGETRAQPREVGWRDGALDLPVDPLTFGFEVDDAPTPERSASLWHDILASIWSCRAVTLLVDASDEMFTLLAGVLAATMRRRALMFRLDDVGAGLIDRPRSRGPNRAAAAGDQRAGGAYERRVFPRSAPSTSCETTPRT